MDRPEHVLVVDDDADIRTVIDEYLTEEGFRVSLAADGGAMQAVLEQGGVDIVILDVRLPGEDGLTLAAKIKQQCKAGIIMLSRKDDLIDRVAGLEVGADDYVTKPFHLRELLARLRSVLRRRGSSPADEKTGTDEKSGSDLCFAGYELNRHQRQLFAADGKPVDLSPGEFNLLLAFVEHPKRALSRDQILDFANGKEAAPFDRSIDVQVGRLRRKIEVNPRQPELIKTVRGVGYMFDADVGQQ